MVVINTIYKRNQCTDNNYSCFIKRVVKWPFGKDLPTFWPLCSFAVSLMKKDMKGTRMCQTRSKLAKMIRCAIKDNFGFLAI